MEDPLEFSRRSSSRATSQSRFEHVVDANEPELVLRELIRLLKTPPTEQDPRDLHAILTDAATSLITGPSVAEQALGDKVDEINATTPTLDEAVAKLNALLEDMKNPPLTREP